jgi:hypothetical protein
MTDEKTGIRSSPFFPIFQICVVSVIRVRLSALKKPGSNSSGPKTTIERDLNCKGVTG